MCQYISHVKSVTTSTLPEIQLGENDDGGYSCCKAETLKLYDPLR